MSRSQTFQEALITNVGELKYGLANYTSRNGYNFYEFVFPSDTPGLSGATDIRIYGDIVMPDMLQEFLNETYAGAGITPINQIKIMRAAPIFPCLVSRPGEVQKGLGRGVSVAKYILDQPEIQIIEVLTDSSLDDAGQGEYAEFSVMAQFACGKIFLEDQLSQLAVLSSIVNRRN